MPIFRSSCLHIYGWDSRPKSQTLRSHSSTNDGLQNYSDTECEHGHMREHWGLRTSYCIPTGGDSMPKSQQLRRQGFEAERFLALQHINPATSTSSWWLTCPSGGDSTPKSHQQGSDSFSNGTTEYDTTALAYFPITGGDSVPKSRIFPAHAHTLNGFHTFWHDGLAPSQQFCYYIPSGGDSKVTTTVRGRKRTHTFE